MQAIDRVVTMATGIYIDEIIVRITDIFENIELTLHNNLKHYKGTAILLKLYAKSLKDTKLASVFRSILTYKTVEKNIRKEVAV